MARLTKADKMVAEQRELDPTLNFLLAWKNQEDPRPPVTAFEMLQEIACDLANDFNCRVVIRIDEPQMKEHGETTFSIAPETIERLVKECLE